MTDLPPDTEQPADLLEQARTSIEELTRARERSATVEREQRARIRELEQTVSTLLLALSETRKDIERTEQSTAWRIGHLLTRTGRRLLRRPIMTRGALRATLDRLELIEQQTRLLPHAPAPGSLPGGRTMRRAPLRVVDEAEREAGRRTLADDVRRRLGRRPDAEPRPVSMIVLTHQGLDHLKRLVGALVDHTDYPALELVVVDNASTDGTTQYLAELEAPFPIQVHRNERNVSFSEGNNQGAHLAEGELLLFANNDIVPFERHWLTELVALRDRMDAAAVGATLLRVEEEWLLGPTVQHRGVRFSDGSEILPYNDGDGDALFDAQFGVELRCPAVTAACLLMTRDWFDRVGGMSPGYRYGTEDVDLGLKLLAAGGEVWCSGRSVAFHNESSTQDLQGREFQRLNRLGNRRAFLDRWGARVRRENRLALLDGDEAWAGPTRPHIAITLTSRDVADGWGDWYTAHEMGEALEDEGWRVTYVERKGDAWYDLPEDLDYVLALMDVFDLRRVDPRVVTIAWIRNWTDRWLERPWFARADVLLASSAGSGRLIEARTGRPSVPFPLATNPERFAPAPVAERYAADFVFTGNHWGEERAVQRALTPREGERLRIFGRGWDEVPEAAPYAEGPIAYDRLRDVYASATIVIDDTAAPTLPYGAVNCRVFDALACGRLPLTNCAEGVHELFDDEFPTWSDADELRVQLDVLLADPDRREALAARYRDVVLERHTYAHRARELTTVLRDAERGLSFVLKIGAPSWDVAERWGDLHFARAMERELRRRGHRCLIQVLEEWEEPEGLEYDVAVVLKGLSRHQPKPGQLNVLWNISHPELITGEECDSYDLICVASPPFAAEVEGRTRTPVIVLDQATDPRIFYPDPDGVHARELAYVANSRNVLRPIVRDLLPTGHDLAIYGANWAGLIDTKLVVSEHVPNDELRRVYSSAAIVLNDHWDDMRAHGFVSNRIYDALACGAVVVSDDVAGIERFGDAVVTYGSPEELRTAIAALLDDPEDRAERGRRGMELVRSSHTFAHRVDALLDAVERVIGERDHPLRVRPA